jgi:hypothetical protein
MAVFDVSADEIVSITDTTSAAADFSASMTEAGSLNDAADIAQYMQAPLAISPMRNRIYRRC